MQCFSVEQNTAGTSVLIEVLPLLHYASRLLRQLAWGESMFHGSAF